MNIPQLQKLIDAFAQQLQDDPELQSHQADHERRSKRAQKLLDPERIPTLNEDDLKELFFDTDAFGFWSNKEWEFNNRLHRVGLDGMQQVLLDLANCTDKDLQPEDLNSLLSQRALGLLLTTELMAYLHPNQYWTYNTSVTLETLKALGEDIKGKMPRGKKSDPYLYFEVRPFMDQIAQMLQSAGLEQANYLLVDIFLWFAKNELKITSSPAIKLAEILRDRKRSTQTRQATGEFLQRVHSLLTGNIGPIESDVGLRARKDKRSVGLQFLDRAYFFLSPKVDHQPPLTLAVIFLMDGRLWWGFTCWSSMETVIRIKETLEELDITQPDEQLVHGQGAQGAYQSFPGGGHVTLGKALSAEQLESVDLDQLALEIAEYLAGLYDRLQPHLPALTGALELAQPSNIWLLQAVPDQYDIIQALEQYRFDDWRFSRYQTEVQAGDQLIFWKSGSERGIYGLGKVISGLHTRPEGDQAVDIEYTGRLREPILYETLQQHPVLSKMHIMRNSQGTNFRVITEEWDALQPLLEDIIPTSPDAVDARAPVGLVDVDEETQQYFKITFPDLELSKPSLEILESDIRQANQVSPDCWSLSRRPGGLRLNIGRLEVGFWSDHQLYLVLHQPSLAPPQRKELEQVGKFTRESGYASVPGSIGYYIPAENVKKAQKWFSGSHNQLVELAAGTVRSRTGYYRVHAPEAVTYLNGLLDAQIPQPAYTISRTEFVSPEIFPLLNIGLSTTGLHFTDWQLATFYTALQTKGFVILSGISGTGKTKLAQAVAEMMPQFTQVALDDSDVLQIRIQMDHLKRSRFVIPQSAIRMFDFPDPGTKREIDLVFDNKKEKGRLNHYAVAGRSPFLLASLRKQAGKWLENNFEVGDALYVYPKTDDENALTGLEFQKAPKPSGNQEISQDIPNHLFVSVRPDWRDGKSLLGYYNPLTGTYEWTPFLRFLEQAVQAFKDGDETAWFVILDEMNLARVEYYFADLLSVLESGRNEQGWTKEPLRFVYPEDADGDLPPAELYLSPNLYVVGTVNMDETTHAFSPKVLDRAFTLEIRETDFRNYPPDTNQSEPLASEQRQALLTDFIRNGLYTRLEKETIADFVERHPEYREQLQALNQLLMPYDLHFGYRVFDEIIAYLDNAERNRVFDMLGGLPAAFDAAIQMKVLPKFYGARNRLEKPLLAVLAWCINPEVPAAQIVEETVEREDNDSLIESLEQLTYQYHHTAERVLRMLLSLYTTGFAAFG